jgi:hypothetical protein
VLLPEIRPLHGKAPEARIGISVLGRVFLGIADGLNKKFLRFHWSQRFIVQIVAAALHQEPVFKVVSTKLTSSSVDLTSSGQQDLYLWGHSLVPSPVVNTRCLIEPLTRSKAQRQRHPNQNHRHPRHSALKLHASVDKFFLWHLFLQLCMAFVF